MAFSLKGVHAPHRKNTSDKPVVRIDTPKTVTIPMSMHIGAPATPVVKVGDEVKVGTLIGDASRGLCAPIHSSVSGKVTKITEIANSRGGSMAAVVIESDGQMTPDESITAPTVTNRDELIAAIKSSGIVGLGGAGFPTGVKLDVDPSRIDYIIINGAECEPYVTSDTVTMTERAHDMEYALNALKAHLKLKNIIIGIEANKKKAIANMKSLSSRLSDEDCAVSVKVLPAMYPQGGEKVLIYTATGRQVPAGKLPIDVGCIVMNCTTVAAIGAYLKTGMPLVEKCVTVDGGAIATPRNVIAPIGTSISEMFDFCGGLKCEAAKVIYGGPMMGITVPDTALPVIKNTNALLALTERESRLPKTTACIRCGACTNTCPFGLAPAAIARAYDEKNVASLEELNVMSCMECGCCSFTCPANRPLTQTNKLAKDFIRQEKAKEAAK